MTYTHRISVRLWRPGENAVVVVVVARCCNSAAMSCIAESLMVVCGGFIGVIDGQHYAAALRQTKAFYNRT